MKWLPEQGAPAPVRSRARERLSESPVIPGYCLAVGISGVGGVAMGAIVSASEGI
jgi:hypothetical protein